MKILGIIAEYDPFHRGHARHLRLAKEAVRPDFTLVALSGCFKQRGEMAMLSPYDRAGCALDSGADAVFALPTAWTVRDAEHYALGAVSMLRELGATHLAFGAETGNLEGLRRIAEMMEHPMEEFRATLREGLDAGLGYPMATSLAMAKTMPEDAALLESPNNTLAICYLRAIQRLGAETEPVLIPRTGGYHAEKINPMEPSASAVRAALNRGDYAAAYEAVPEKTESAIRKAFLNGVIPREEIFDHLLISRLRELTREEADALPCVSEGLGDRLRTAAGQVNSRRDLLDTVSGKRYPKARISRICAWAMLDRTAEELEKEPLPQKAVLLGLRANPEMTALWREKSGMVTAQWENETDIRAWRLWAQCTGQPNHLPWSERVVRG